jgi:hypothetical protein
MLRRAVSAAYSPGRTLILVVIPSATGTNDCHILFRSCVLPGIEVEVTDTSVANGTLAVNATEAPEQKIVLPDAVILGIAGNAFVTTTTFDGVE